jgi:hypothetical protein
MDQRLLKALEDIGMGLEALVEALESKEESKSDTGKALQSGDFGKQLQSISVELKSIKADTQEILKNQRTLLGISKEKEKESSKDTKEVEAAGDTKKKGRLKEGIGTILLIAVAVLAIGMAFKLVGEIDFMSVVALGLAIYVIAQAFEKVAMLKLSLTGAFKAAAAMVLMSIAVTMSSYVLQNVVPVGIIQLATAVAIAGVFAVIGYSLERIAIGVVAFDKFLSGRKIERIVPIVLVAIATAITLSSWIMTQISPISLAQAVTALFISLIFTIIGYTLHKIAAAVVLVDKALPAAKATYMLPLVLVAIATAITMSSWVMQAIIPISFVQALTALVISVIFMIIGYALPYIAGAVALVDKVIGAKKAPFLLPLVLVAIATAITMSSWVFAAINPIGWKEAITAFFISIIFLVISFALPLIAVSVAIVDKTLKVAKVFMIPIVMVAIATAMMLTSHIFKEMADLDIGLMFKILIYGVILAIVVTSLLPAIVISGKVGIATIAKGSIAILLIALTIMVSSHILAVGNYENYPGVGWITGVGISLTVFALAQLALGYLAMADGGLGLAIGALMVMLVAGTIMAVSHILSKGEYNIPGFLQWSIATSLLFATFVPILLVLGAVGLASAVISFFGPNPWEMARGMILEIAQTIVDVSHKLQEGDYKQGPTKEWAEGIAIALGAFAPVYKMLVDNAFWSVFGMGGIGPDEFAAGIKTVTSGIVTAANEFAANEAVFKNGPPVEWADGVGKAIAAFSPVYGVLLGQGRSYFDKIFGGPGPTVEDMKKAIMTISQGIVDAAEFFNEHQGGFAGAYPSKAWGEGVGAAISGFAPVFTAISNTPWYSSPGETIAALSSGITSVASAIVEAGRIFGEAQLPPSGWDPKNVPNKEWGDGVAGAIKAFGYVFDYMKEESGWFTSEQEVINNMCNAVTSIADAIAYSAQQFTYVSDWKKYPTSTWANNVSAVIKTMTYVSKFLIDQYGESDYEIAWGLYTMSLKIKESANFLSKVSWDRVPNPTWALATGTVIRQMAQVDYDIWRGIKDSYPIGGNILRMSQSISGVAKHLYSAAEAFEYKVPDDFIPALRKVMFDFQDLVFEMIQREDENKSFADKFLARLGMGGNKSKDPVLIMADRLIKLAKGYDALATSLIKLSGAMTKLNLGSVKDFGGFNANLLSGKMVQPGKFEKPQPPTLSKFNETKSKKDQNQEKQKSDKKEKDFNKDIKEIIKILKGIEKNTSTLDDYISEMTQGKIPKVGGGLLG